MMQFTSATHGGMSVIGKVRLECVDSQTGHIKWHREQPNQLTNYFEEYWNGGIGIRVGNLFYSGNQSSYLSLSTYAGEPKPRSAKLNKADLPEVQHTSREPISGKYWFVDPESRPRFVERRVQFSSQGTAYSFQTILFHPDRHNDRVLAYAILPSPCHVAGNEVLKIFYRFEISPSPKFDPQLNARREQALFELLAQSASSEVTADPALFCSPRGWHGVPMPNASKYPYLYPNTASVFRDFKDDRSHYSASEEFMFHENRAFIDEGKYVGKLLRCAHWGHLNKRAQTSWWQENIDLSQLNQIQGVYGHRAGASAAFFKVDQGVIGSGKVVIEGDGHWIGTWPEAWEIIIEAGETAGEFAYRFRKGPFGGWFGNRLDSCRFLGIPYINQGNRQGITAFERQYVDVSGTCLAIDRERICTWRPENEDNPVGFNILNLSNGEYEIYDSVSDPPLHVQRIYQISSNRKITGLFNNAPATKLCIAADTGLYEFDLSNSSLTQIRGAKCIACDYGSQDEMIAIFIDSEGNPEIVKGSEPTTPLPLMEALSVADIYSIRVDKNALDFDAAILVGRDIVWWSTSNGGGILGPSSGIPASASSNRIKYVQVSGTGSHWAVTANRNYSDTQNSSNLENFRLIFNTTEKEKFGQSSSSELQAGGQCFWIGDQPWISGTGGDAHNTKIGGSLWNADLTNSRPAEAIYDYETVGYETVYKRENANISGIVFSQNTISDSANGSEICLYLDDGLVFFGFFGDLEDGKNPSQALTSNYYAVRPLQDSRDSWMANYGWDSEQSQWVLGNTATKPIHTAEEALMDGLTIRFEPGNGSPAYHPGDTWNFTVMNGFQQESKSDFSQSLLYYINPALGTDGSLRIAGNVPTGAPYEVHVPEAPEGASPDPHWRNMLVHTERYFQGGNISGAPITQVNLETSENPEPDEITVYRDGRIVFNEAKKGQAFNIPYAYVRNH
jgi:hypothetical protein